MIPYRADRCKSFCWSVRDPSASLTKLLWDRLEKITMFSRSGCASLRCGGEICRVNVHSKTRIKLTGRAATLGGCGTAEVLVWKRKLRQNEASKRTKEKSCLQLPEGPALPTSREPNWVGNLWESPPSSDDVLFRRYEEGENGRLLPDDLLALALTVNILISSEVWLDSTSNTGAGPTLVLNVLHSSCVVSSKC